jgi:uncharacterized protein YukE
MLVSDGGSISVEPAALHDMAARVAGIAASTSSARGSVAGASSAAAGCDDPAAGAFARLQVMLTEALGALDDCSTMISQAVSSGAEAYVTTDAAVCPAQP